MKNEFKGKRILVTGGTGSIGSIIVRELLGYGPRQIRVLSRDESKQFELAQDLPADAPINLLIGDVADKERVMRAMEGIDIVFHAAAMKHVAACERNPFEAVRTNVDGTQNIIDAALAHGVEKVIAISTDKAANPTNVMGTTKLLAERLVLSSFFYKGTKKTKFACVRFGNVLWSRGSALPLFVRQIRRDKAITLTDPSMTRFFMSIKQAVSLVFKASTLMQEREVFVLKMPTTSMGNVVAALQEILTEDGIIKAPVPVRIIGKKEGERLHEKLLTKEESETAWETNDLFILPHDVGYSLAKGRDKDAPVIYKGAKKARIGEYVSNGGSLLSVEELKPLLREGGFHKQF